MLTVKKKACLQSTKIKRNSSWRWCGFLVVEKYVLVAGSWTSVIVCVLVGAYAIVCSNMSRGQFSKWFEQVPDLGLAGILHTYLSSPIKNNNRTSFWCIKKTFWCTMIGWRQSQKPNIFFSAIALSNPVGLS